VDDAEPGRRGELGPVGRAGEPVEVVAQERVDGGPGVRGGVGEDDLVSEVGSGGGGGGGVLEGKKEREKSEFFPLCLSRPRKKKTKRRRKTEKTERGRTAPWQTEFLGSTACLALSSAVESAEPATAAECINSSAREVGAAPESTRERTSRASR
jgi:hypothetical protein